MKFYLLKNIPRRRRINVFRGQQQQPIVVFIKVFAKFLHWEEK